MSPFGKRTSAKGAEGARRYRTIVADPPWAPSDERGFAGRTKGGGVGWQRHPLPYPDMSVAAIAALPVSDLADSDARLFLWTINRYLPDAFSIVRCWGFEYRQTLAWHKTNASPYPGSVAVLDLEFLLVAQRGTPGRLDHVRSSLISAAISRHSEKPDAFLDLVETVSPGPRLELFARRQRLGWDTWGDEALNHLGVAL